MRLRFVVALATTFLCQNFAAAQDFEIRLDRSVAAGAKYRIVAKAESVERMGIFAGERLLQQKVDDIAVEFAAVATALEVDIRGKPSRYTLAIEKLLVSGAGATQAGLEAGTVVHSRLDGQRFVLTIGDKPVDPLITKAISMVIPLQRSGVTDDDVFGTRERKRVGDSWPVNSAVAAKSLGDAFKVEVNQADVIGSSTLEGVVKASTGDYLVIGATLVVDNFSMPLPEGIKVHSGRVSGSFSGRFPTDLKRIPYSTSMKMAADVLGIRPAHGNTPELAFRAVMERSVTREFEELK